MKIWEAIIYGIFGGITELLPISFNGHYAFLRGAFNLSSLTEGSGYYIRAAISLGIMVAVIFGSAGELRKTGNELLGIIGIRKIRRGEKKDLLSRRTLSLVFYSFLLLCLSFIYRASADRMIHLLYSALLFGANGLFLYLCNRGAEGKKYERETTLPDALLIGASSAASVFPGFSVFGSSLSVGHARGLSSGYALRYSLLLFVAYQGISFLYYLIRAFLYGSFAASVLLSFLLAMVCATVFGYLALQYLRYMLGQQKLGAFSGYCWTIAIVMLILSLINA